MLEQQVKKIIVWIAQCTKQTEETSRNILVVLCSLVIVGSWLLYSTNDNSSAQAQRETEELKEELRILYRENPEIVLQETNSDTLKSRDNKPKFQYGI